MKKRHILMALICGALLCGCTSNARDNHEQGLLLYNEGKYEQATQYFLKAVAENNGVGSYYVDLGMNYLKLSDYTNAQDAFQHAVSLEDSLELAYRGLGIMYLQQNRFEEAISSFDSAIEQVELNVGPLEYDILQYLAEAEISGGKYKDAADTLEVLIKLGVNVADNTLSAGKVYLLMGDEKKASEYFDKALESSKQQVSSFFAIYNAYEECGFLENGAEFLNRALEVEGASSLDHLNRGKIYYIMGNYPAAITELSYPLGEDNAEAALYTAFCYEEQGDYESACGYYVKSLEKENNPLTANYYAMCLSKKGDDNHAWNVVHTTMENFPDCDCLQDLKWNEIILYEKLNMMPSALTRLQEYQKAYPDDPNIEVEMQYLTLKQNNMGE